MTYDEHFLSRLKRASDEEVRFAMSLYYDSAFTRDIIKLSVLPEQTERLAFALSDDEGSSHAVLSRDGAFVTCLGPGMKLGDLPVITQHQFAGLRKQHQNFEKRFIEIEGLMKNDPILPFCQKQRFSSGRNMTREEYKKYALFQLTVIFQRLLIS